MRFLSGLLSTAFGGNNSHSENKDEKVLTLSQFKLMRIVGRGAFGKVRIVEHRETRQLYALKYINKEECIRMDAARNIIRERVILEQLDHPFLCRLRFAFQDRDYMYMVTDLMLGGDLHYHLQRQPYFSEDVIRFWFAELASAVKYLHLKQVVHRDIKPQNILMDEQGHVHLTDFNIATYLHTHKLLTSNSGTGYYMAPEVYKGNGYNESVDWWSLGITLYECVYHKKPFEYDTTEELQAAIRRGHINYPKQDHQISNECLAFIQGLLDVNPSKRLGYGDAGWIALVHHPFFRSIDWNKLESKSITPLFQPGAENNFDITYDLEELLLEESPLTAHTVKRPKSNKKKINDPMMSKHERDLTMIEEKFKNFDFTIFEKYEGFKDPVTMTVGDPPDWVKPAFKGAEQGDVLPIKRIDTGRNSQDNCDSRDLTQWKGPSKSVSTSNICSRAVTVSTSTTSVAFSNLGKYDQSSPNLKRSSTGTLQTVNGNNNMNRLHANKSSTSLSEEYALSLQGLRKKQSTKSFMERRERDRKSIQIIQHL
ncbi:kinase-like domain-containing protein [Cokeromyces recurvatus]|uniref:kinase-like domain-containing protein n=1 Tax=Cokeromyces recurvatus TaxID=90255 RepID=UPI00221E3DB3|nr:kinase-like domain-containing protein [Cokeromyces recurvatus]KAI7905515.1 kinase-like domain-containing protein [Cokeromyces recurvatus]